MSSNTNTIIPYKPRNKPDLIVFDIDQTLIRSTFDHCPLGPPNSWTTKKFRTEEYKRIKGKLKMYEDIPEIFRIIDEVMNIPIGIASMGGQTRKGFKILEILGLKKHILDDSFIEIHRGSKEVHFRNLKKAYDTYFSDTDSSVEKRAPLDYKKIIFFDDRNFNLEGLGTLGVHGFNCRERGVTLENFYWMLEKYDFDIENDVKYPDNVVWEDKRDAKGSYRKPLVRKQLKNDGV